MKFVRCLSVAALALIGAAPALAKDWKHVTVAMEGAAAPWNLTSPQGELVGFEVDLMNDICTRAKLTCEAVAQDWDGLIPGLNAGKYDIIMDGMSITEERQKAVDFSLSYARSPSALVGTKTGALAHMRNAGKTIDLAKDDAAAKEAIEQLRADLKGKNIGLQSSTIQATFADKYLKDVASIHEYKTNDEFDADLINGRIDATLADTVYDLGVLEGADAKDLAFVGPQFQGGPILGPGIGAAFRKQDKDLQEIYNKALQAALDDGSVKKYSEKWFKIDITPSGK